MKTISTNKTSEQKRTAKIAIIIVIFIIIVVGYYTYLSNKTKEVQQEATLSVVQNTLARDLSRDYPPTPKEVVKYYNEILKCFYNEECTEGEIEALGNQARELYDAELLENNELGTYLLNLQKDIQEYRENNRRITSVSLASSTNVDFYEEDGFSFARIMCGYDIMEGTVKHPSDQVYLLRQDEEKKWKIYGWQSADEYEEGAQ